MQEVNNKLKTYIEKNIFPKYERNDKGHQIDHIQYVIKRSFSLSKELNVNKDMVYTIDAYHDCGYYIDKDNHEKIAANMVKHDIKLKEFFSLEEIKIMQEAIEDHRASLSYEPRNIYGKIISSADRNVDIDVSIQRIYWYSLKHFPDYTLEQHMEEVYEHAKEKFGSEGYAKMYFRDELYENYLETIKTLLSNKQEFIQRVKRINEMEK